MAASSLQRSLPIRKSERGLAKASPQAPDKLPTSIPQAVAILQSAREPRTRKELQEVAEMRNREHFVEACLRPLIAAELLEMTLPDKPRSPKQRYRCTQQGLDAIGGLPSHDERNDDGKTEP